MEAFFVVVAALAVLAVGALALYAQRRLRGQLAPTEPTSPEES